MSEYLINMDTAGKIFSQQILSEYQNGEKLGTVGISHDMIQSQILIPMAQRVEMNERGFSSGDIAITDVPFVDVNIVPHNFTVKGVVGDAEQTLFPYDKLYGIHKQFMFAGGRRQDKTKLDAIAANTFSAANNNIVAKNAATTAGTGTGLSISQIVEARTKLQSNGFWSGQEIFCIGSSTALGNLFNDPKFTQWFTNTNRPLNKDMDAGYDNLLGLTFLGIPDVGINSLPFTGSTQETKVYLVGHDALHLGYNKRFTTKIVPNPSQDRTEVLSSCIMGATVVHETGCIEITCDAKPQFS